MYTGTSPPLHPSLPQKSPPWPLAPTREPVAVARVEVVRQVDRHEHAAGGRVDGHVVRRVVKELGARVSLHVVRVEVSPPKLDVDPVLVAV